MSDRLDDLTRLKAEITQFENQPDRFHERVNERLDQVIGLLESRFRSLSDQVHCLKRG
jgi:hypothetical protein